MLMNLLSNNGYIVVNKEIIKLLGLNEAVILGELCSEYTYWERENKLNNNYFFSTRENIQENTGLSPFLQRNAIKTLVSKGIIKTKELGMPSRTWYSLNEENIMELLFKKEVIQPVVKNFNNKSSNDLTACSEEISQPVVKEFDTNNNNININKNSNNLILSNQEYEKNNTVRQGEDEIDKITYEQLFKQNIEYNILTQDDKTSQLLDNITNVAVDILNTTKDIVYINSEPKNVEIVRSQLLKLKARHISYVINCLEKNIKDVKSIKSYILTALYNAINTIDIDVTLQVAKMINEEY